MTIHDNGFFYTGVRATEQQEESMQQVYKTPFIIVGEILPPAPEECVHAYALHHGLPEIQGHYGYDFKEHEFVRLPDADQGEPDKWPSHRLGDVLNALRLRDEDTKVVAALDAALEADPVRMRVPNVE